MWADSNRGVKHLNLTPSMIYFTIVNPNFKPARKEIQLHTDLRKWLIKKFKC